jgi:hypothetical protein
MKNIIKTLIVMLSSISLFASANAGELSVSGTAKATYNIQSGQTNAGKGLGITNELNFTASGETDAGYTWSYSMELDPGSNSTSDSQANAQNDDTKLTLGTPYGTLGVFVSEGGLDVEDAASQSVYARPTDIGDPSATEDNFTIDSYNNVQYHTPADLLPFGTSFKIAYAPNTSDTAEGSSGNNAGAVNTIATTNNGRTATEYQIKTAPYEVLTCISVALLPVVFDVEIVFTAPALFPEAPAATSAMFGAYATLNVVPKGNKSAGVWYCTLL